jgi:hypothetical protein
MEESENKRGAGLSGVIPFHGGYRDLKSYQMAGIVHDAAIVFCDVFINRRSPSHDQMVQAVSSGRALKTCCWRTS